MGKQNHIIRKLVIEIGLPTQEEAFRIQNRLTDEYRRIILAIIEEILDRLVREEEIITVDRLEIDLGHVTAAHLSEEISRKVKQEMEEAVTNLLYELRSGSAGAAGIRMKTSRGDSITVQARRSHTAESSLETLAYFLEYGIFPWSEDRKKKPSLREMIGEALEKRPEELLRMLAQSVTKKHVFRRLALQLPEDQLCYLCAVLGCSFSAQLSQVFSGLEKIIRLLLREISRTGIQLPFPPEGSELHFRIREEALRYFASGEKWQGDLFLPGKVSDPVVKYFAVMFFSIIGKSALAVSKLPVPRSGNRPGGKSRKRNPVDGNFAKEISEALALFAPRGEKQTASKSRKKKKNAGRKAAPGAEEEKREVAAEEKSTPLQYAEEETPPAEVPAEDGIYVANSGLIILHPYLSAFFKKLQFLDGRNFADTEKKHRAVHLLHWLVYGDNNDTELTEHDLVLNKLLCGLKITEPVPVKMELTETEKNEGEILLKAIIKNWSAIRNTSVHGLRKTFLQKEGRLTGGESEWELFIHRDSGVEILIDRLPWGISMIKFPWNEWTIYTQW